MQLRYYQDEAVQSIFNYFNAGNKGNPVIAMPTGTGKSLVIAAFIKIAMCMYPSQRIMMLTHVKELIAQNAEKLKAYWPQAPLGIFSAGLNCRQARTPIVFGGVQSVKPAIEKALEELKGGVIPPANTLHFGWIDLLIIDECHLLSDKNESAYQYVIAELKKINPFLKVIGLTATPFRLKMGLITENGIFTDFCYDITGFKPFNILVQQGFLSPLIAKPTKTIVDTSKVKLVAGEFNSKDLEKATSLIIESAVNEMMELAYDRKAWLVFATGIDNTEQISEELQSRGLDILPVHSKLPAKVNDERIAAFRAGELRGLVSGRKLTTGFDHPPIDFIGDVNPTNSPSLHGQKLGRGTRPFPGKLNCLYGDFGGNVARNGPINDLRKPKKPGEGGGEAPIKICEVKFGGCGFYNHASARYCEVCGKEFLFQPSFAGVSSGDAPMKLEEAEIKIFKVDKVIYNIHNKKGSTGLSSKPTMKVTYFCGTKKFDEFVSFEHSNQARLRAVSWWNSRSDGTIPAPQFVFKAVELASSYLSIPKRLKVKLGKDYPEIIDAEF